SATAPNTPAGGTGPPASAFGGTAQPKTARMAADATSDSSSNPAAPGTAAPASAFGGTALGKGLPGGSILEYFIQGPGPIPGPGIPPAPQSLTGPNLASPAEGESDGASTPRGAPSPAS